MSKKVAVIGECMTELSKENGAVNRGFGGDTLNTSIHIARQIDADTLNARYVTVLGIDAFSQQVLDSWQQKNVDVGLIQRVVGCLPGLYCIRTDGTGGHTFYCQRNEATAKFWLESGRAAATYEELATFNYFYLSSISLTILGPTNRDKLFTLLRECRASGGRAIFDNNYRPRLWVSQAETQQVYQEMLAYASIVFLTLDDEDTLWGEKPIAEVIAHIHIAGMKGVVVKHGTDAYLVSINGQPLQEVSAIRLAKERMVDITTVGNSFSVGYLAVRLTGGDAESVAKRRHLTASTVIQYHGAIAPWEAIPQ